MKKVLIAIIVLAVLAAGSLTAFFIVRNNEEKKENEKSAASEDYALFSYDTDSINHVDISCEDGSYSIQKNEDNIWSLADSDEFTVRQSTIQNIYTIMSYLTAEKDYGEATDEAKEMFGLDDPTVITLSNGTYDYTLFLGDADPTGTYYYAMTDSKSKIYAISADYGEQLKITRIMLKDRYLTNYGVSDIANIKLVRDGETAFEANYDTDNTIWSLSDEYSEFESDQSELSTMVAYMVRIEAQQMLDENLEDLSKYGFDQPYAELILTGLDGKTHKYLFSYYGTNTNTYTHVLFEDTNQVAAFYTGDVDFINKSVKDFIVNYVCNYSIFDVSALDYSYEGIDCSFTIDKDNNKFSMDNGEINLKDSDISGNLTDFYNSICNLTIKDIDINISPELSDPVMSLNITLKENNEKVLVQFTKADEENFYVFKNNEYTGFIVAQSDVIGQNAITGFYDKLARKSG